MHIFTLMFSTSRFCLIFRKFKLKLLHIPRFLSCSIKIKIPLHIYESPMLSKDERSTKMILKSNFKSRNEKWDWEWKKSEGNKLLRLDILPKRIFWLWWREMLSKIHWKLISFQIHLNYSQRCMWFQKSLTSELWKLNLLFTTSLLEKKSFWRTMFVHLLVSSYEIRLSLLNKILLRSLPLNKVQIRLLWPRRQDKLIIFKTLKFFLKWKRKKKRKDLISSHQVPRMLC